MVFAGVGGSPGACCATVEGANAGHGAAGVHTVQPGRA